MEEKIMLIKYVNGGSNRIVYLKDRDELGKWMDDGDGSIQDGDQVLICKDYEHYNIKSEVNIQMIKV